MKHIFSGGTFSYRMHKFFKSCLKAYGKGGKSYKEQLEQKEAMAQKMHHPSKRKVANYATF